MYRGRLSQHDKSLDQTKASCVSRNAQNQGDVLQKQIQSYTRKFEQEKRKLFRAQENHREILKDYQNQVIDLESLKTKKYQTQISNLNTKIKCLEINLQKGITAYNEALSKNNTLKSQIDELRKDKKNQKQAFKSLSQKIEELNSSINEMGQSIEQRKNKVEKAKQKIMQVRQVNEKENEDYINYVRKLKQSQILMKDNMKNTVPKPPTEASDTQPIVKLRIRNLIHHNKQKIKIAELYKRGMEKIEQSFLQIKQQSGINDLQEITKTFLKQEEQNTLIFQYINKLTTELEMIREENQNLGKKIEAHEEITNGQRNLMGGTPEEQEERIKISAYYAEKQKHIDRLNSFLHVIQPKLLQVLKIEKKSLQSIVSYSNIESYLAQLEQAINGKIDLKQEGAGPQVAKSDFTKYSKPLPTFSIQQLRDKGEESIMEPPRFRDYASDFWEKKRQIK